MLNFIALSLNISVVMLAVHTVRMYRLYIKYSSHVYLIVFDYYVSYVGVHIVIEMKQMTYRSKSKYTLVASCDAERSFPAYKLILTDKRQQLTCKYRKITCNLWRPQSQ